MNRVQIAAHFYDANDAFRRLFGERYDSSAEPYRRALKQRMADLKLTCVEAALHMLSEVKDAVPDISDQGLAQAWILAAAVDVMDGGGKTQLNAELAATLAQQAAAQNGQGQE